MMPVTAATAPHLRPSRRLKAIENNPALMVMLKPQKQSRCAFSTYRGFLTS
jgi:hypothetical protein